MYSDLCFYQKCTILCFYILSLCRNKDVTLINFALSKHLVRENELLTDQCGSLAYVSPEILSGTYVMET